MGIVSNLLEFSDIGIDLGSKNMRVWVRGRGLVLDEPCVVTLSAPPKARRKRVVAVGVEAGEQLGKTSEELMAVRPFEDGISHADRDITKKVFRYCFEKAGNGKFRKPRVVIGIPSGMTDVEKRRLEYAARAAGAGRVFLIESTMAAAIGAGLAVSEPRGCMIVDIGASSTNIALISNACIISRRTLPGGGDDFDHDIMTFLGNKYDFVVGAREAEDIKIKIGTASEPEDELEYVVRGLVASKGRCHTLAINSVEIREEALFWELAQIEKGLTDFIRFDVPPDFASDIAEYGFVLTGGGALLPGLEEWFDKATGFPVVAAEDPAHATICGIGAVLDALDSLVKHDRKRGKTAV